MSLTTTSDCLEILFFRVISNGFLILYVKPTCGLTYLWSRDRAAELRRAPLARGNFFFIIITFTFLDVVITKACFPSVRAP